MAGTSRHPPRSNPRFIMEYGIPGGVPNCNTVNDLDRYLKTNPHCEYHLVSCQFLGGTCLLVWEDQRP